MLYICIISNVKPAYLYNIIIVYTLHILIQNPRYTITTPANAIYIFKSHNVSFSLYSYPTLSSIFMK